MKSNISVEDFIAIQNLIGLYQWLCDDGDPAYADLYLEDGAFLGGLQEPVVGRENLRKIPEGVKNTWNGGLRHTTGSMFMRYGDSKDEVIAKYYNLVTTWHEDPPALFTMALSEMHLVRVEEGWKIKSNTVRVLAPALSLDDLK